MKYNKVVGLLIAGGKKFNTDIESQLNKYGIISENAIYLEELAVDSNYRCQGIGSTLVKAFLQSNHLVVYLRTGLNNNEKVINWYNKFGIYQIPVNMEVTTIKQNGKPAADIRVFMSNLKYISHHDHLGHIGHKRTSHTEHTSHSGHDHPHDHIMPNGEHLSHTHEHDTSHPGHEHTSHSGHGHPHDHIMPNSEHLSHTHEHDTSHPGHSHTEHGASHIGHDTSHPGHSYSGHDHPHDHIMPNGDHFSHTHEYDTNHHESSGYNSGSENMYE